MLVENNLKKNIVLFVSEINHLSLTNHGKMKSYSKKLIIKFIINPDYE